MALIVSRPSDPITDDVVWDNTQVYHNLPAENTRIKTKATLVIAPVALVYQWAEELRTKTRPSLLKVLVYYGSGKTKNPETFRRYDGNMSLVGYCCYLDGFAHLSNGLLNICFWYL